MKWVEFTVSVTECPSCVSSLQAAASDQQSACHLTLNLMSFIPCPLSLYVMSLESCPLAADLLLPCLYAHNEFRAIRKIPPPLSNRRFTKISEFFWITFIYMKAKLRFSKNWLSNWSFFCEFDKTIDDALRYPYRFRKCQVGPAFNHVQL